MTQSCTRPLSFDSGVAYLAGDLAPEVETDLEEHLLGCGGCTEALARISAITESFRSMHPPVINASRLASIRSRGARIKDNPLQPGERKPVTFPRDVDILLHRLGGLDLRAADRVDIDVCVEETGDVLYTEQNFAFDRDSGEVLIACQQHFSVLPPNIVIEVRVTDHGVERSSKYAIPHRFEGAGAQ
jgi:hypothetical protein